MNHHETFREAMGLMSHLKITLFDQNYSLGKVPNSRFSVTSPKYDVRNEVWWHIFDEVSQDSKFLLDFRIWELNPIFRLLKRSFCLFREFLRKPFKKTNTYIKTTFHSQISCQTPPLSVKRHRSRFPKVCMKEGFDLFSVKWVGRARMGWISIF